MLRTSSFHEFLVHFEMCVERQRCQVSDGVGTAKLVDESVLALGRVYHILIYRLRPLSNNGGDRSTEKTLISRWKVVPVYPTLVDAFFKFSILPVDE